MNTPTHNTSKIVPNGESAADLFGDAVYTYSRADALADGYLIDITDHAKTAGFRVPAAITRAAWEDCVAWEAADERRKRVHQDQSARLLDVLTMAMFRIRAAMRHNAAADRTTFPVLRIPRDGCGTKPREATLEVVIGGDDEGVPCITIGQPEDF